MSATHGAPTPRCATPHCACGACYSPGSVLGDWMRRHLLRRSHRYRYDERGGVVLPAWVSAMWDGEAAQSWGTWYDEAR